MAPEACQSEPYTSKSDVWALGCILYELCTLKKPFEADNLLGLVFKIVTEKQIPVPSSLPYSKEIR
jgi:NIMA (never in mitosis gene a)-related kinase